MSTKKTITKKKGGRPRTGYLFRRDHSGGVLPIDGDSTCIIWLRYTHAGERVTQTLNTCDADEARRRRGEILAAAPGRSVDRRAYLEGLVRTGEWAKRELLGAEGRSIMIADGWAKFLSSRRRRNPGERTLKEYKTRWGQFAAWCAASGLRTFHDVDVAAAERYVVQLEAPRVVAGKAVDLSGDSVNTHLMCLRMVWGVVTPAAVSPWAGMRSAKGSAGSLWRRLTVLEVQALCRVAEPEYRLLVVLGFTSGLRLVDCALMEWSAVDLELGRLTVKPRKTAGRKRRSAGRGVVQPPILPDLRVLLSAVGSREGYILPAIAARYANGTLGKALAALWDLAGVKATTEGLASFRSLRVTFQSLCDDAAVSRVAIRSVMGHESEAMSDTYSRLDQAAVGKAVGAAIPALGISE